MKRAITPSRRAAVVAAVLATAALLHTLPAAARCGVVNNFVAQDVTMDMGQVVIPPELPVGAVIKRIEVPINGREDAIYCDFFSSSNATGRFVQAEQLGGSTPFANVYPTRVAGIGIRVFRQGSTVATYYPHELPLFGSDWPRSYYDLDGGRFIVELVKTATSTGSGPIANNGRFTTYYIGSDTSRPVLTSTFRGQGTTIVYPTCKVDAGSRNIVVDFGQVPSSRFGGVGTRAQDRDFAIRLTCHGSNVASEQNNIGVRLDSTRAHPTQTGVLRIDGGPQAAQRVGIEVVRVDGSSTAPVTFGQSLPLGRTRPGTQTFELPLRARYIQTEPGKVRPGRAGAQATFTIEYD